MAEIKVYGLGAARLKAVAEMIVHRRA
jgi:hypothetical protein